MENDRMGMAPGAGGRPPEQPLPPAAEKPKATRRESLVVGIAGVLVVALVVWLAVFAVSAGRTPAQVVNSYAGAELQVQEELVMVSLPGSGESYVFFYIATDQLACALLENRASGFKVVDAAGGLPLTSGDKQGIWKMMSLKGSTSGYFVFGLLYDDGLTRVAVNGERAVVVDTGVYRCWYFYSEDLSINSESVVYS